MGGDVSKHCRKLKALTPTQPDKMTQWSHRFFIHHVLYDLNSAESAVKRYLHPPLVFTGWHWLLYACILSPAFNKQ